ncbi:ImmA/IrrE family metallo-endopeptidase [Weissella coleopterorum]|uniref:ImmA/IrrE family metallo-endopeptidase n=1 Tax=Weissella coleopterorum TaxID=2714949 RepID=A0A6G8AYL3_9LACO|nr:ImmA/IrrE family metallo-endopeptidase [Weissella coleopterorum]QIL50070.1 ImmA/IrrE family metallo-endopeptidase [Weissella coleopterorum]
MRDKKIDWDKINKAVAQSYVNLDPNTIPFNLFKEIDKIPNFAISSYQDISSILNIDIDTFKDRFHTSSNDAFIRKYHDTSTGKDLYTLFYNDNPSYLTIGRIRFSIAHELGHFYLNHLKDQQTQLDRGGIDKTTYKELEIEANHFASLFLINPIFITDKDDYKRIEKRFDVSSQAARIAFNRFKGFPFIKQYWKRRLKYDSPIKFIPRKNYIEYSPTYGYNTLFESFELSELPFIVCRHCKSLNYTMSSDVKFCPVCSSNKIEIKPKTAKFHETEEQEVFEYKKIPVEGKPSHIKDECPTCGNEVKYEDDFCDVCGLYLINRCAGHSKNEFSYDRTSGDPTYLTIETGFDPTVLDVNSAQFKNNDDFIGCEYPCSGKARYCAKCGSVTTFYLQSLFESWDTEKINSKGVTDEDLPF